jgi:hypothetical protein
MAFAGPAIRVVAGTVGDECPNAKARKDRRPFGVSTSRESQLEACVSRAIAFVREMGLPTFGRVLESHDLVEVEWTR